MKTISDIHFTLSFEDDVICLVDVGTGYSITNGADLVIAELYLQLGADLAGKRVIYRDTMGVWDGLAHRGNRFIRYVSLGGVEDRATAIERARALSDWPH